MGILSLTKDNVGKCLKRDTNQLLKQGIPPDHILFLTGELIDDHHALVRILEQTPDQWSARIRFIIIDEVTYIKSWDRGVKYWADAGFLENTVLLLTGFAGIF